MHFQATTEKANVNLLLPSESCNTSILHQLPGQGMTVFGTQCILKFPLSISTSYCCCCLILWLASPQGLFNHYHFQFSLAHWACVLRNNFPRGDLSAFFFRLILILHFQCNTLFSLGAILLFYVSIPVVFIVPVTSVPPTNFIHVLFPLLQNTAFFSIYDEASFPIHPCLQNNKIS